MMCDLPIMCVTTAAVFIGAVASIRPTDNRCGRARAVVALVLVLGAAGLAGCTGGPAVARPPAALTAQSPPPQKRAQPEAATGADTLVRSMRRSLALAGERPLGEALVSLDGLSNHSHASPGEFAAFKTRLAAALSRAGAAGAVPIRFVTAAGEPVDYELAGTAYLVTAQGFDQWELYLSLRPPGESWEIWRADGPVHTLRQPRGEIELE